MKKRTLKRLAAAIMTSAMMIGLFGTSAMAAEPTPVESVTLTKTVTADPNVLMPATEFTFAIANGTGLTTKDGLVIYDGVANGATFANGNNKVTFAPGGDNEETLSIVFDASAFTKPGVYRYEVTETAGNYDGMTYSEAKYYMDLYVVNGSNGFVVASAVTTNAETEEKANIAFENTYATNNLTLTKVISGNQADMTATYNFTVTIDGATGEKYATNYEIDGTVVTLETGVPYTFTLGHNESVVIYGLSATDSYTIVEDDAHLADGYTTTIDGADEKDETTLTATGTCDKEDDSVTYTNTKEVATPTGVILTFAPYIAMIVLAGAVAFLFMRRRRVEF